MRHRARLHLCLLAPPGLLPESPHWRCKLWARSGGINYGLLRRLRRAPPLASVELNLRMALLNTRSLANKTFLLNDFTSRELDVMLLTETWLQVG